MRRSPSSILAGSRTRAKSCSDSHTPPTLGNFVIGVNHVLPTGGWARTGSPLTVFDFMKRTSVAYVTGKGYPELARHAEVIATYEGFDGHANAVSPKRATPAEALRRE